jgi:hypothetical protein
MMFLKIYNKYIGFVFFFNNGTKWFGTNADLSYPMFYDCDHKRFVDLISDNRIVVSTYIQLAKDVGKMGAYADMMHMYALSAVLKVPIRSYYPPQLAAEFVSQPRCVYEICNGSVITCVIYV